MAIPRVFISSTCYDLKHIRESLKYFVKTVGYDPVLSDDGDVYYNPSIHTHDSCLKEVETCQLFILIIGGRYGGTFKDKTTSITNNEYKEAVKNNIPIFALIESAVYSDHNVFSTNKKTNPEIVEKIAYPSVDTIKIFDFLDEVRKNVKNNAIFPFGNFSDIECYLKKQWAGMMYDFLLQRNSEASAKVTNKLLDDLTLATQKSQELIKALLQTSDAAKANQLIEKINYKVEAENFPKLVHQKFDIKSFPNLKLKSLIKIDLQKNTWMSFLEKTAMFSIEEEFFDNEKDLVIWCDVSDSGRRGRQIGHYDESDTLIDDSIPELERAYEALKKVDEEIRIEIYKKLINNPEEK